MNIIRSYPPLDAYSEVLDERRRWQPEWYNWITRVSESLRDEVTPYDFGAKGDGIVDDTGAVAAALDTAQHVNLAQGIFRVTAPLVMEAFQWMRNGKLIKDHTGDMLDMTAQQSALYRVELDCNSKNGRGVIIDTAGGNTQRQFMGRTFIYSSVGPALEFLDDEAGFLFTCEDCVFGRVTSSNPGVILPTDTVGSFGGRWFYNCHQGGNSFIDLGGSKGTRIFGGSSTGIVWSNAACQYSFVIGHRMAFAGTVNGDAHTVMNCLVGNTLTINGTGHNIGPNIHDGNSLIIGDGTTGCTIFVSDSTFTDNSTPAEPSNKIFGWSATPTPTWNANATNPTLGNGTIIGRAATEGTLRKFALMLTIGSTSTIGTGAYIFRFAAPWNYSPTGADAVGQATFFDSSASAYYKGAAIMFAGTPDIYVPTADGTGNFWGSTSPVVPAQGDIITLELEFNQ